ncbi:MAG: hypothetical protein NZ840_02520 [Anaerolineales bacterium]|nr:hypothetical protein [Anaerolineales bacterium]MDW8160909.1 hypothetical protein [Anaerolineales bacterium]
MVQVDRVDLSNPKDVHRFITLPFRLYQNTPQWVPPFLNDSKLYLNPKKHPFYRHSAAEFYIARKEGEDVGRIAVLENRRFNEYHQRRDAQFYFFDSVNDLEVAKALFACAAEWAKARGLDRIVGPKGMGPLDGYGILVEGFEHRQMMMMMNYNHPYYKDLLESLGFTKEVDFVSCYLSAEAFRMPERIHHIAQRVQERGTLKVLSFENRAQLRQWAKKIGQAYNRAFVENWEYYPLTDEEIQFVLDSIVPYADPKLIKVITHRDEAVGFLFGFPDISAAMQRARGKLNPITILDILLEMRRTEWVSMNGAGILPQFHGRGGNALLYSEMEKTARHYRFKHAELTQVAETAVQMRRDLENLGGKPYKNHRVFSKNI